MRKNIVFLTVLLSIPMIVLAEGMIKAGLWEMTLTSDAIKNMPKMPAEQMEAMRKMGINIPQMQDGGIVTKVCITNEMANRDQPPPSSADAACRQKNYQRKGDSYSMELECNTPHMNGIGIVKGTFSNRENFNSSYDFKGTMQNKAINQHHETSGKWISADCGNVQPFPNQAVKK